MNQKVRPRSTNTLRLRWLVLAAAATAAAAGVVQYGAPKPTVEAEPPPFVPELYAGVAGPGVEDGNTLESGRITNGVAISLALARKDVPSADIDDIVAALRPHFDWRYSRPGHRFDFNRKADGSVDWFRYEASPTAVYHAYRSTDGKMRALVEDVRVQTTTTLVDGKIDHSLYLAMEAAGEGAALTLAFVDLFAWDIDFFTEARKGDRFRLIVEKRYVGERFVGYGAILGAEYRMSESNRHHRAVQYTMASGREGYYTPDGSAVRKAFLKSPIQFASITSRFGFRRHPILKYRRAHRGVDYGAPRGAAIWAIGDGVVRFAGRKGGYGRVVYLRHANGLESRYAHLSAYGKGIRSGVRVAQKQVIGLVGSSGLATGPHLHFEILKRGKHVNPLTVAVPPAPPIPDSELGAFKRGTQAIVEALDVGRWPQ